MQTVPRRIILALFTTALFITTSLHAETKRPKLAVILVYDQMRGDYLTRWQHLFQEGGFKRVCQEGAWFQNCRYPYGITMTAAGHASIGTGCVPSQHGIVGNDWWEPAIQKTVYAVESDRWKKRIWADGIALGDETAGSPERLLVSTLGNLLKEKYGNASKVIAISAKDRSALLMGGTKSDATYWLDKSGYFATSSFFGDRVHDWVKKVNNTKPMDRWFGKSWERCRADVNYDKEAGPDDVVGEGNGIGQGRTFPHPFSKDKTKPDKDYYEAVVTSPMASDVIVDLAIEAIRAEKLGQRETPDLLCVSFSSNDLVGHSWGPDSQEVLDVTLRSDQQLKRLLDELDTTVGKDNYVVTISADHGVCPLSEVLKAKGIDAGRLFAKQMINDANKFLNDHYKTNDQKWIAEGINTWIALHSATILANKLDREEVATVLARWTESQPGVWFARTRSELGVGATPEESTIEALRLSYRPERSGDVIVVPKPHYFFAFAITGTSHGTPHPYDRHVPGVYYGANIKPGVRDTLINPQAIVPTYCRLLGIEPPANIYGKMPDGLIIESNSP